MHWGSGFHLFAVSIGLLRQYCCAEFAVLEQRLVEDRRKPINSRKFSVPAAAQQGEHAETTEKGCGVGFGDGRHGHKTGAG
jgi:hypothetical protein